MALLGKILDRVNVLVVDYRDGEHYSATLMRYRRKDGKAECEFTRTAGDADDLAGDRKNYPVVVVLTGYGVICKEADKTPDIVRKVTAPDSGFVYSEEGGRICFVRRAQVSAVLDKVAGSKSHAVGVECSDLAGKDDSMPAAAADRYFSDMGVGTLLRPTQKGSVLCRMLAVRARLYVLCALLLLAGVNAAWKPSVRTEYEGARAELELLKERQGAVSTASRQKAEALEMFKSDMPLPVSLLCDRAAMALPGDMGLTAMAVCPPVKRIENGKIPEFRDGLVTIDGHALRSSDVLAYVTGLEEVLTQASVNLATLEYDKDNGRYVFAINVGL